MPQQARFDAPETVHNMMARGIEKRNGVTTSAIPKKLKGPGSM